VLEHQPAGQIAIVAKAVIAKPGDFNHWRTEKRRLFMSLAVLFGAQRDHRIDTRCGECTSRSQRVEAR
jgi:hypothetical protein